MDLCIEELDAPRRELIRAWQSVDDGRVSRHPIKIARALTPGVLELGHWNTPSKAEYRKQPVRNFIGYMDEFSIYSKALKDSDIERLAK